MFINGLFEFSDFSLSMCTSQIVSNEIYLGEHPIELPQAESVFYQNFTNLQQNTLFAPASVLIWRGGVVWITMLTAKHMKLSYTRSDP